MFYIIIVGILVCIILQIIWGGMITFSIWLIGIFLIVFSLIISFNVVWDINNNSYKNYTITKEKWETIYRSNIHSCTDNYETKEGWNVEGIFILGYGRIKAKNEEEEIKQYVVMEQQSENGMKLKYYPIMETNIKLLKEDEQAFVSVRQKVINFTVDKMNMWTFEYSNHNGETKEEIIKILNIPKNYVQFEMNIDLR